MIKYDSAGKKEKLPPANGVSKSTKKRENKKTIKFTKLKGDRMYAALKNTVKYGRH